MYYKITSWRAKKRLSSQLKEVTASISVSQKRYAFWQTAKVKYPKHQYLHGCDNDASQNITDTATVLVKFHAEFEGQYECHLVLKSMYDVRVIIIESTVLSTDKHTELEFSTKALLPLTQNIPLVSDSYQRWSSYYIFNLYACIQINPSTVDWPLVATLNATSFKGPEFITAQSLSTTQYPLTFSPHREGIVQVYST